MKKTIAIIALSVVSLASFGQGYFNASLSTKSVWDGFSQGFDKLSATMDVGLYIGNTASAVPAVASGNFGVTLVGGGVVTNAPGTFTSSPWSTILTDPNFAIATNENTLAPIIVATTSGGAITVAGTVPIDSAFGQSAIGNNALYFVAWSSAYATPTLAAAAGSAVGWSGVFTYAAVSSIGTPPTMAASGFVPFGVDSIVAGPEPSTMAIAAIGGASLLLFRRRK